MFVYSNGNESDCPGIFAVLFASRNTVLTVMEGIIYSAHHRTVR